VLYYCGRIVVKAIDDVEPPKDSTGIAISNCIQNTGVSSKDLVGKSFDSFPARMALGAVLRRAQVGVPPSGTPFPRLVAPDHSHARS
jgi:hypothetical protein